MPGAGHRLLPHTADTIVEAWGPTRAACIEQAVLGLVGTFAEPARGSTVRELRFDLGPTTPEELPAALLDEVVYLLDARGVVPVGVAFDAGERAGPTGSFSVVDVAEVEPVGAVPKGVARSDLRFERDRSGRWRCRVTIDV